LEIMENNKPEIRELTLIAHPEYETVFPSGTLVTLAVRLISEGQEHRRDPFANLLQKAHSP